MSTEEIDRMVYEKTTAMGGIPAPLNYQGFPKSVCTSINEEVCHGIPSEDIISVSYTHLMEMPALIWSIPVRMVFKPFFISVRSKKRQ